MSNRDRQNPFISSDRLEFMVTRDVENEILNKSFECGDTIEEAVTDFNLRIQAMLANSWPYRNRQAVKTFLRHYPTLEAFAQDERIQEKIKRYKNTLAARAVATAAEAARRAALSDDEKAAEDIASAKHLAEERQRRADFLVERERQRAQNIEANTAVRLDCLLPGTL